VQVEKHGLLTL